MLVQVKELLKKHQEEEKQLSLVLEKEFLNIMSQFGDVVVPVNLSDIKNNFETQYCQHDSVYGNKWDRTSYKDMKSFNELSLLLQAELIEKVKQRLIAFKKRTENENNN